MIAHHIDEVLVAAHLRGALGSVESALGELGYDSVVIPAGEPRLFFLDDQHYPYRPNPWFTWLVPASRSPGSVLHVTPGSPPRLLFMAAEDFWYSPAEAPDEGWVDAYSLDIFPSRAEIVSALAQLKGRVAWLGEEPSPVAAWDVNPPRLLAHLEQARCRKNAYELACMREASRIAVAGHLAAERAFRQGACEYDIHLAYLAAVRQLEEELPYSPIIAANEHGAVLHYQRRDRRTIARPLSLLIDAGASCRGYASDITRSWGWQPGLFASLIEGMNVLQQQLCAAVAPGIDWPQLHLQAHLKVAALLREADLLRVDAQQALARGISRAFFPHGLGHLLGVQVHDVGGFRAGADAAPVAPPAEHPALRLTRRLETGMVVTVEPGMYFIDSLLSRLRNGPDAAAVNWPLVDRLAPYGGIRIEDDVVVTATGHENLTRTAFADVR